MAEAARPSHGLMDTSVVIDLDQIDAEQLPNELAISALTMAELAAGPHATGDCRRASSTPRPPTTSRGRLRPAAVRWRLRQSLRADLRGGRRDWAQGAWPPGHRSVDRRHCRGRQPRPLHTQRRRLPRDRTPRDHRRRLTQFLAVATGYGDASWGYGIACGQRVQFAVAAIVIAGVFSVFYLTAYQAGKSIGHCDANSPWNTVRTLGTENMKARPVLAATRDLWLLLSGQ